MRRSHLARITRIVVAGVVASSVMVVGGARPVAAASYTLTVTSPVEGRIGVDAIYSNGGGGGEYDIATCSNDPNQATLGWNRSGQLDGSANVPNNGGALGTLVKSRFELYPGPCGTYDGWVSNVGGVHFETAPTGGNLGNIVMPVAGQNGAFRIDGNILSATPIGAKRVAVDSFQITTGYPEPAAPLQNNGIVEYGSFASNHNQASRWTGGVGWSGRYLLFVTDTVTGRSVTAAVDITAGNIPTIDLDAICFGFNTCTESGGSAAGQTGSFHSTQPTRILDTRNRIGITNGPIRNGQGAHPSPDPITRYEEAANHDLKVTGRYGIPESGVSAVLLNVTAVDAPATWAYPTFMSIIPKPARVGDIFNDQGTYTQPEPTTSNLNLSGPEAIPNLVLARVGAGGHIRIFNYGGGTHLIADVAGWYGTASANINGTGFSGITPLRALDTRNAIGGPTRPFANGETRTVAIAGRYGIPQNAESVVVNITTTAADGNGYITAWPTGAPHPNASNNNFTPGVARANTSVVQLGAGGAISIAAETAGVDVIVDILGSYGPGGSNVTSITPVRVADTRTGNGTTAARLGTNDIRSIQIAGVGAIPANATAIIANVTAVAPTSYGYLTAWPSGTAQPNASTLNFAPGQNVPNLAMLKLGTDGALNVFNEAGTVHVLIDVTGYTVG